MDFLVDNEIKHSHGKKEKLCQDISTLSVRRNVLHEVFERDNKVITDKILELVKELGLLSDK